MSKKLSFQQQYEQQEKAHLQAVKQVLQEERRLLTIWMNTKLSNAERILAKIAFMKSIRQELRFSPNFEVQEDVLVEFTFHIKNK